MRKLLALLTICIQTYCLSAQFLWEDECDFEETCPYLKPINDTSIWEIGNPDKKTLNNCWNSPNCLVTDEILSVDTLNTDFIQFDIPCKTDGGEIPTGMTINFFYRYDFPSPNDYCKVLMAFDSSEFKNVVYWSEQYENEYFSSIYSDIPGYVYNETDTGITGLQTEWRDAYIFIIFYMTASPNGYELPDEDTVRLRIQLKTDSIDNKTAGIAIDEFSYKFHIWGNVQDYHATTSLHISPNPVSANCQLFDASLKNTIQRLDIYNMTGQLMQTFPNVVFDASGRAVLSLEALPSGTYICDIASDQSNYRGVVVKL